MSPEEKSYSLCLIMALRWNSRLSKAGAKMSLFGETGRQKRGCQFNTSVRTRHGHRRKRAHEKRLFHIQGRTGYSLDRRPRLWESRARAGRHKPISARALCTADHIKQDSPRSRQVSRHRSPSDSLPRNARRRPALPPTCVPSRASVRTLV